MEFYPVLGVRFILGFGVNIKSVQFMPIEDTDNAGEEIFSPFNGVVINLPFMEIYIGYVINQCTDQASSE